MSWLAAAKGPCRRVSASNSTRLYRRASNLSPLVRIKTCSTQTHSRSVFIFGRALGRTPSAWGTRAGASRALILRKSLARLAAAAAKCKQAGQTIESRPIPARQPLVLSQLHSLPSAAAAPSRHYHSHRERLLFLAMRPRARLLSVWLRRAQKSVARRWATTSASITAQWFRQLQLARVASSPKTGALIGRQKMGNRPTADSFSLVVAVAVVAALGCGAKVAKCFGPLLAAIWLEPGADPVRRYRERRDTRTPSGTASSELRACRPRGSRAARSARMQP